MIVDIFLVYQFIKRLATPFKEWEAYKLGIIDEKGNQLKKRKEFTKQKEHNAFGLFDVVIVKLKRLLEKVPGGNTRLGSYAAALWLIKESKYIEETDGEIIITEAQLKEEIQKQMTLVEQYVDLDALFERAMEEEGIANVVSNVAGTGGAAGEPGLTPAQMKKYKKKNQNGMPLKRFANYSEKINA